MLILAIFQVNPSIVLNVNKKIETNILSKKQMLKQSTLRFLTSFSFEKHNVNWLANYSYGNSKSSRSYNVHFTPFNLCFYLGMLDYKLFFCTDVLNEVLDCFLKVPNHPLCASSGVTKKVGGRGLSY